VLTIEVGAKHALRVAVTRTTTHDGLLSYLRQAAVGEQVRLPSSAFAIMAARHADAPRVKLCDIAPLPYAADKLLAASAPPNSPHRLLVMRKKQLSLSSSSSSSATRATDDDDDDAGGDERLLAARRQAHSAPEQPSPRTLAKNEEKSSPRPPNNSQFASINIIYSVI
jgi:hypothetical protein